MCTYMHIVIDYYWPFFGAGTSFSNPSVGNVYSYFTSCGFSMCLPNHECSEWWFALSSLYHLGGLGIWRLHGLLRPYLHLQRHRCFSGCSESNVEFFVSCQPCFFISIYVLLCCFEPKAKVLDVPDPDVLAQEFPEKLPCEAYPSDHLALVADLWVP